MIAFVIPHVRESMPACIKCGLIRADLVDGACPACRPKGIKQKVKFALGLGCLGIIAALIVGIGFLIYSLIFNHESDRSQSSQSEDHTAIAAPATREGVKIDISEIRKMFSDNQVAGETYFANRTALIPGRVVRVREVLGTGILVMSSRITGETIELGFNEHGTKELATLKPSDLIIAQCPSVKELMAQVIITCSGLEVDEKE